jgi:pimeloyl-ACP methyl ester carboxylesterase
VAAFEAAIESFVDDCTNTYGDLVPHVSTMDTVHDLAVLARALGEDQVSLYGMSYGTWTVATFAAVYPEMVRAAVLDAAYYTYMDPLQQEVAYWEAFDGLLVRALEACDASAHCPIQGDAQAAFERVSAAADTDPFHTNTGLPAVNQAALHWLTEILLVEDADLLLEAVAAADQGDTEPLQWRWATAQSLFSWQDRLFAIACMDYPHRDETVLPDNTPELLAAAAPVAYDSVFPNTRLGMITAWICVHWPTEPDLVSAPLTGQGAGPILLVKSTGDRNTNLAHAEQLAEQLVNDTLLIVEGNHHVSYGPYTGNPAQKCATDLIDTFFIELTPPPDRTQCTP